MSRKRPYNESFLNFGFSFLIKNDIQIPQCVICFKTLTNESMKPSKLREHFVKVHPELVDKGVEYLKLKAEGLKRAKLDASGTFRQESNKIMEASYYISLQIAKNKKPHTIGEELIKPCLLETARLVLNEGSYNKIKEISISNNTVQRRIQEMAIDIKEQVIEKIHSSPFFSIQLDESTDVAQCSQLMVFARYVHRDSVEEEFLFCRALEATTKADDVMAYVSSFFEEAKFPWNKLVGVCTDGAPAMLGSRSGFIAQVKQRNPDVVGTHCMIHREALASKTLPAKLRATLTIVIKVVNFVKGSALNTRLFRQLCTHYDSIHHDLLFYTQVRWLSKGNMLDRVTELRYELETFLDVQGKNDLFQAMKSPGFATRLAYLVDVFELLNNLNKKLQGRESNIIAHSDHIRSFNQKLLLWNRKLDSGNCSAFHMLSEILGEELISIELKEDIRDHLSGLQGEFERYFPGINTEGIELVLARDPYKCKVDELPEDLQEEFLELTNNSFAKIEYNSLSLNYFWVKMLPVYPKISKVSLLILIPFSSTYLCEAGFSSLLAIKTKQRNKLESEGDLRCALSKTDPRLTKLVGKKEKQVSH